MRLLEQCTPTISFEVASENERDAADVEEREQAQIVRISEHRIVVVKDQTCRPAGSSCCGLTSPVKESTMLSSSFIAGLMGGVFSERMLLLVMLEFRVSTSM